MRASRRSLLLGLCFLALLLTDYGVSATTRVHAARRMMIQSAAMQTMQKLNAIMSSSAAFRVPGSVDAGVPLSQYPTHKVLDYDMSLPTFGYLHPDDVDAEITPSPFFVETRSRRRVGMVGDWVQSGKKALRSAGQGIVHGAEFVGGKIMQGAHAVAQGAGKVKDAVVGAFSQPTKPICTSYYDVDASKGDKAALEMRNARKDTLRLLGRPQDGQYHPPSSVNFYKWDYATGKWMCSPTKLSVKEGTAGWKSLDQCSGDNSFRTKLFEQQFKPIASADVLEVLQCPEDGGGYFKYKAGVLVTPIWFRYDDSVNKWQWSPDFDDGQGKDTAHWMSTDENKVSGGQYAGRSPVQENLDIMTALSAYAASGFGNLPENFGENWFVGRVRSLYRSTIGAVITKIKEYEAKLSDLVTKIRSIKWSDITNGLSTIMTKVKEFLGQAGAFALRLVGAIIFGLLNGILMGMLDQLGEAWSQCPDIQKKVDAVMQAASDVWQAIKELFSHLSLHTVLDGCHRVFARIADFFKAVWDIVWGCEKLRNTVGLFLIIIVAGLILNAVMVASGYGAVFKVVLALVGLVMAVPFIISKTVALVQAVGRLVGGGGQDALLDAVRNYCNIAGCIIGIIFLVKEIKANSGAAQAELANSPLGKKFGFGQKTPLPDGTTGTPAELAAKEGPKALQKVEEAQKAAGDGAKAKVDPKEVGIADEAKAATSEAKPGEVKPTQTAKPGQQPKPTQTAKPGQQPKPGQTPKPGQKPAVNAPNEAKLQVDMQHYEPGKEAAKLLGEKPNANVVKGQEWVGMPDNPNAPIKGLGAGESGGQKLFWDPETNCWRNAKGSRDPLTGASLDGKPVGLDSEGNVAVDLCKVNPAFCKSSKQPSSICRVLPIICGEGPNGRTQGEVKDLAGLPRNRMPQATWVENGPNQGFDGLVSWLKAETGNSAISVEKSLTPVKVAEMAPTQAEINLQKTLGIAEKLKFQGKPPPPPLVIENPNGGYWIVDGHHRWSGVKLAAEMDPSIAAQMKVNVIKGITPEKLFTLLSKLADAPQSRPDVATFAPLLELQARVGQGIQITESEAKAAWLADVNARFQAAGVQWRDAADADELWDKVMRDRVMSQLTVA